MATPASGFSVNYVNVVAPDAAVGSITLDGQAVIVDHGNACFTSLGDNGGTTTAVQVDQQEHFRAIGDCLFGLCLLRASITFSVNDGVFDTSFFKGSF